MVLRTIRNATITGMLKRVLPALAAAALVGSVALPAHADDDDWRGHGHGWGHEKHWHHHPHYYGGPGYYYSPPVYYAPPPVVYAPPPPVVYAPPAIYEPPSVNFVFPLHVR